MGLIEKFKAALLAKRVTDRLREAHMKGKLWATLYGLGAAAVAGVIAKVNAVCPALIPNLWPLATGAVVAGVALYMQAPEKGKGLKATVLGVATAIVTAGVAKLTDTCPTLAGELWATVGLGAAAGIGLWLKSPKQ